MGFAILRTQKLKSVYSINRSLKHAFREQETPNADDERRDDNVSLFTQSRAEALERFKSILPEKRRKNAVLAVEYLMTASPEDMQGKSRKEQIAYFNDCIQWLKDKHGEQNIVNAGVHFDETTPHLYAYVVPMDEKGKLNCRAFLGGAKALSDMQSDFAERVGKKHGLERGIKGSKAKHTRIKDFYKNLDKYDTGKIDITPKVVGYKKSMMGLKKEPIYESNEQVAKRVYEQHIKPIDDKVYDLKYKAKKAQEFSEFFEKYHKINTSDLSDGQIAVLSQKAEQFRQEKKAFEKAKEEQERIARQEYGLSLMRKGKKSDKGMKI